MDRFTEVAAAAMKKSQFQSAPPFIRRQQTAISSVTTEKLSAQELEDFDNIFYLSDTNRDGVIEKNEFKRLLETVQRQVSEPLLTEIFRQIDTNGDGRISFDEFCTFLGEGKLSGFDKPSLLHDFKVLSGPQPANAPTKFSKLVKLLEDYLPEDIPRSEIEHVIEHFQLSSSDKEQFDFASFIDEHIREESAAVITKPTSTSTQDDDLPAKAEID